MLKLQTEKDSQCSGYEPPARSESVGERSKIWICRALAVFIPEVSSKITLPAITVHYIMYDMLVSISIAVLLSYFQVRTKELLFKENVK